MKTWNDYKETMYIEPVAFEYARTGLYEETLKEIHNLPSINEKNAKGHSLLMLAAYNDHFELTRALIKRGADVNSVDNSGNSILMGVAFKGHASIIKELVTFKADTFYKNPQGQTALDFAYMFGRTEVAEVINKLNLKTHEPIMGFLKSWISFSARLVKAKN
ncbi:MAG: ankyrin repeat domain-containing protein [Bdellovibrionales bacterium]|nr:ankyrin repeat domain-containing protein [Bdellovibrionales bacterium]